MSERNIFGFKKRNKTEDTGVQSHSMIVRMRDEDFLCAGGYKRLSDNPEVKMATDHIANIISSMTIHLMKNEVNEDGEIQGAVRVHNSLARKLDINPCKSMTRKNWMMHIVKTLLVSGDGNCVVYPIIKKGLIEDLVPLSPSKVSFVDTEGGGYRILCEGKYYDPDEVLHFVINPDEDKPYIGTGYRVTAKDIVGTLQQATVTKQWYYENEYNPNIAVMVNGNDKNLQTYEGRNKFAEEMVRSGKGKPLILPDGFMSIEQLRPLTLDELAIKDGVEIDKKTIAGIFSVPLSVLKVGDFNEKEYNNFINTTVLPMAKAIEQELTRKLIMSEVHYVRFNPLSLYSYDRNDTARMFKDFKMVGIVSANEARDAIGLSPKSGLNEFSILENFIPVNEIGNQNKLKGGEE